MFYAKTLVIAGLVLLAIGLLRRQNPKQPPEFEPLLRDRPGDLKDTIYHPKEWRKPK